MELHHDHAAGQRQDSQVTTCFWTPEQRQAMIETLDEVQDIWAKLSQESVEAFKASNILRIMLEKIKNPEPAPPSQTDNLFGNFGSGDMQPEHSAAMTLGMLSGGVTPNGSFQSPGGTTYPNLELGPSMGPPLPSEFQPDAGAANNAASPFSMFTNLGSSSNMALDQNFDWVRTSKQLIRTKY
jgi:hypothetical protein